MRLKAIAFAIAVSLAFVLLSYSDLASAESGLESTQLDYVALDPSVDCTRTFFRGSLHQPHTIFVMPRVVQSAGPDGANPFTISRMKDGSYKLFLKLYFPKDDESLQSSMGSTTKVDNFACNWDQVKYFVNHGITDEKQLITTIGQQPLTSIRVKIPGIEDTGLVGRIFDEEGYDQNSVKAAGNDVHFIDYFNRALTFEIRMSEDEKASFMNELIKQDGVPAKVEMKFQGRSRNGSVLIKVDAKAFSASFLTHVSGKKLITRAELDVALQASADEKSIQITNEAGNGNGSTEKYTALVLDKILSQIDMSLSAISESKKDKVEEGAKDGDEAATINVKAAVEVIKSAASRTIQYEEMSGPVSATDETEVAIKYYNVPDPNVREISVRAQYADPSTEIDLKEGDSMFIAAGRSFYYEITYPETKTYLTETQIKTFDLQSVFPILMNPGFYVQNEDFSGMPAAVGKGTFASAIGFKQLRWLRTKRTAANKKVKSVSIPTTLQGLKDLHVGFSFAGLSRKIYKFSDLTESGLENQYFRAFFDENAGRLEISAYRNLGTLQFRENMEKETEYKEDFLSTDEVQQETRFVGGAVTLSDPQYLRPPDHEALTYQRVLVFHVGRMTPPSHRLESAEMPPVPAHAPALSAVGGVPAGAADPRSSTRAERSLAPAPRPPMTPYTAGDRAIDKATGRSIGAPGALPPVPTPARAGNLESGSAPTSEAPDKTYDFNDDMRQVQQQLKH